METIDLSTTIFVVGAGASAEYGLPIGSGLREQVVKIPLTFRPFSPGENREVYKVQKQVFDERNQNYAGQLLRSGVNTIDNWLSCSTVDKAVQTWCKTSIANILLNAELNALVTNKISERKNWISVLHNKILSSKNRAYPAKPLEFITFNYDRVIDLSFIQMMQNTYRNNYSDAVNKLGESIIRHRVYGSLQHNHAYELLERNLSQHRPLYMEDYVAAASGISLIPLERDGDQICDQGSGIAQRVQKAEFIVFLGFGFDETNLRRLGITPNAKLKARLLSTRFGCNQADLEGIEELLPQKPFWGGITESCGSFLSGLRIKT